MTVLVNSEKQINKRQTLRKLPSVVFLSIATLASQQAFAKSCKIPKSYYKNVECTNSKSYFLALKDSGQPVAILNKSGKKTFSLTEYSKVLATEISNGLMPVYRKGSVGYVNMKGHEVIPAKYQAFRGKNWARAAKNNRIIVKRNGGLGVITTNNRIIVPFSSSITRIDDFSKGKTYLTDAGTRVQIDTEGVILSTRSKRRPPTVKTNNQQAKTKKSVVKKVVSTEVNLTPEQITVLLKKNKTRKTNEQTANITQKAKSAEVQVSNQPVDISGNTVKDVSIDTQTVSKSPKNEILPNDSDGSGTVNKSNTLDSAVTVDEMFSSLQNLGSTKKYSEKKYGSFIPHQQNGKWGFVDENNLNMITYSFDAVEEFSEEMAAVKIDSKWGFINLAGDLVIDFQYLDANVDKFSQNYFGKRPYIFYNGKAWVANYRDGSKLCINKTGVMVSCY